MSPPAISIIIVSYNVRYFLDQCLHSLSLALRGLHAEVFVVDNHSADDSVELIRKKYPWVKLIANDINLGFSKANNQALVLTSGAYVLLLNPDTVVREDTIQVALDFFKTHPDAGAVGVRLIDGTGQFLAESKRGLPTPWVAFCRLSGLGFLFPRSPIFNRYYLGHLSADENQKVDILCGAFMMVSRAALEQVGPLDESFFMYGEDVDWSFRIQQAGFGVYYCANTSIIHYKGESSYRESWPYLRHFYRAMAIFAAKHFTSQKWWYDLVLRLAIGLKAMTSFLSTSLFQIGPFLLDVALLASGFYGLKEGWERFYHHEDHFFPPFFDTVVIPALAFISALAFSSAGLHSPAPESGRLIKRWLVLSMTMLVTYALLPLAARPSRALLLMSLAFMFAYLIIRLVIKREMARRTKAGRVVIVGDKNEFEKVRDFLDSLRIPYRWMGHLDLTIPFSAPHLANYCQAYKADEVIFCSHNLPFTHITEAMSMLGPQYRYRIASAESTHIISSSSSRKSGELYTYTIRFPLHNSTARFNKRLLDVAVAALLLMASPILVLIYRSKNQFFSNLLDVLGGKKTWVGYLKGDYNLKSLPMIKPSVLDCALKYTFPDLSGELQHKINVIYAREYDVWLDVDILIKGFFQLDQK